MTERAYQLNAADPDQATYAERKVRQRLARAQELWRWLLTQKMGREFVQSQLLGAVGPGRAIDVGDRDLMQRQVALHNLGHLWLRDYITRHRDLYLQMVNEATKREDDEREEADTMRQVWARREAEGEES